MTEADISSLRKKLVRLRQDLQADAVSADESSQVVELDQARIGRLSRMDAMQGQAMSQAAGRRRELTLTRITAALRRMDSDVYGMCQSCDEPINPKRLAIDPTAFLCIACAEERE